MATRKQHKLIRRACGTMGAHMLLLERYPAFRARQQRLENETNRRRALGFTAAEIKLAKMIFAPRCLLPSLSFQPLRASSAVSSAIDPRVMRRCLAPILYWTIQLREPPARTRKPKPGSSSSKVIS